ncbi:hypothetical protein I3843_11G110400 [Carya illinoinensis]|uniref:Homeobox-leucine zipper protein n=1 Tax=Carya illinoinensis TaxID=32201 RepID=A0A8T1P4V9_CARIL|nr:homeobox-leucine zipper protein ATHB-12-like isoform X2 [Carya illinoinensis]KAG2680679.1 hypothetical protein I3760_11G109400 [Carya illinoinensis]KAG6636443.1 hypothetical protein CIPAW_11G111900 [Carya illinoinensis]KAG6688178.1 hypothetical protein I3842_11G111300 [Carya illinoinensis]KAG7956145.1 hypothetical protein I3843_11G110400 [Carya illinoinensis]
MRKNKNMRRFNDQQIKSLEVTFEAESRPEAQIKHQLANELGLRPRQVGIWFQNRRARLKTKQVERNCCILKASYDSLASKFESLQRENRELLLEKLKKQLGKEHGNEKGRDPMFESKETPRILSESAGQKTNMLLGDVNECTVEETGIQNIAQPTDGSQASSGDWRSLECSCLPDESGGNSQWWELWSK